MEPFDSAGDWLKGLIKKPFEWAGDQVKDIFVDLAIDYITVIPILTGVSIGVYALVNMFSKGLAKMSVVGVFGYGALLVIFA